METGALVAEMIDDRVIQRPETMGAPLGTRSQYVRYYDSRGRWLVDVHGYLLPNGSLGGSGVPDPKRMLVDGDVRVADPSVEDAA